MKFKSFIFEDENTPSKEVVKIAKICDLACDNCDFETTTEEFVEGDICPECSEGHLINDGCDDETDKSKDKLK
jgi:hypothetical protein